jgi:diadenosine tetraphosphate (Ap4A) HIT family hydrolase
MDEGATVSGVSRGDQRRLYDLRRQEWAEANGLRFVILDYRGFATGPDGRLLRNLGRDRQIVAEALRAANAIDEPGRVSFDGHAPSAATGICSICQLVESSSVAPAPALIWRDKDTIAAVDPFPTTYGQIIVAPVAHREAVTGDFTLHQFLALQRVVYAVAEAARIVLLPERVYILSLGRQASDAHVQWQVVPLPPGMPTEQQEWALLDRMQTGVLALSPEERGALADQLRAALPAWMRRA